jgi:selenocysteine-specific elongation factor
VVGGMILGTAGHIDHGKTALVRALTGVDTDRLPEEKRRGITIDLGFAPLRLDDGTVLGVVDVPGHEAFVRTMLAGATGIDLALLVIAADEGPMPQTREHLAILELLRVPKLVVALTKSDLVDVDWLELVTQEVRELLARTSYAESPIVPTSIVANAGIPELMEQLRQAAQSREHSPALKGGRQAESREPRAESRGSAESRELFRLPIDRSFTVKGTGTVVTGTVWSGELKVDDNVRIMPVGVSARVRGLQSHGASVTRVGRGTRAAIALAGVDQAVLGRGATLVTNPVWQATLILRADLTLMQDAPELRPRTKVRLHLATSDVGARVVAAGSPVTPGSSRTVRIALDEPIMARAGDRFVLRSASPLATIGGGVVTDSNAPRRAKPMARLDMPPAERLALFVDEAGLSGLLDNVIAVRVGVAPDDARLLAGHSASLTRIGDRWYAVPVLADAGRKLLDFVSAYHASHQLETGVPRQEMRSRLGIEATLFDQLVGSLVDEGKLEAAGAELREAGWSPALSEGQRKVSDELLATIDAAGYEPPALSELQARFGPQTLSLLRNLERAGRVVQVEDTRFYAPSAVRDLLGKLEQGMSGKREVAPTDLKDVLGFSRKFLIPFLEYCDKRGYTARQGNGRVWRGAKASTIQQ